MKLSRVRDYRSKLKPRRKARIQPPIPGRFPKIGQYVIAMIFLVFLILVIFDGPDNTGNKIYADQKRLLVGEIIHEGQFGNHWAQWIYTGNKDDIMWLQLNIDGKSENYKYLAPFYKPVKLPRVSNGYVIIEDIGDGEIKVTVYSEGPKMKLE